MKVAISQPTYLPWLGYFDLVDQADLFVILDNVQFAKRSWQQRNRIRNAAGLQWLTVPVKSHGRFDQSIQDVEIADPSFVRDHLRALEHAYRRAPFFSKYFPALNHRLGEASHSGSLADLNIGLIELLMQVFGVRTRILRASTLGQIGKRTELLANLCAAVGATEYLSALGSAEYLVPEKEILRSKGIETFFQNYVHPAYSQVFAPFMPYASAIDLLFNEGEQSIEIIRSGRRSPYSVEETATMVLAG